VAQGVPGRLRPRVFLTFGTTRVVGRQPYAPAAFIPGEIALTTTLPQAPICVCKGQAVPLQAWSGPEGSRKLRFPDFMKTAQDGGKDVSVTDRPPLPPGNTPGTQFC
jgi:hypothetical protein